MRDIIPEKEKIFQIWKVMLTARLVEKKIKEYGKAATNKSLFEGYGQEGGTATVGVLLNNNDYFMPYYRGLASVISRNIPLKIIIAEILGKKNGICQGKAFSPANFLYQSCGVFPQGNMLGNGFSIAIGMGLGAKFYNDERIVAIVFGDGAASRGTFYSALNLSALFKLPIIWICENNQYSLSTTLSNLTYTPYFEKAKSFGIYAECVDGNDIFSILPVAKYMIKRARKNMLPAFLELKTFRVAPHEYFFMNDLSYVNPLEKKRWEKKDPLYTARKKITKYKLASKGFLANLEKETEYIVKNSFDWAMSQNSITGKELLTDRHGER